MNSYQWLEIAKKLQSIAQAGLEYSHSQFDRDRYDQIRKISIEILENYTHIEKEKITELFASDIGYPTPKVDVRAAVFHNDRILLVKEKLDGKWSLPGGWADQHLTLSKNLIKETKEEAGLDVKPKKVLAILDRRTFNYPPISHGCYKIFVECALKGGSFRENTETSDSGFFGLDELPPLSTPRNTKEQIEMCFNSRGNNNPVFFD